jgi:hypothetical protein
VEPRHGDTLTHSVGRYPFADRLHDADTFVTGHKRRSGLDHPVTVGGVDVGVAQPRSLDPNQNFSGGRFRQGSILHDQRLTELANNSDAHDRLLSTSRPH